MPVLTALLNYLNPTYCCECGARGSTWCHACYLRVLSVAGWLAEDNRTHAPAVPVYAAGAYDNGLRTALLRFKERGVRALTEYMGGLLACAVAAYLRSVHSNHCTLTPVPTRASQIRARGYDHAFILARSACAQLRRSGVEVRVCSLLAVQESVPDAVGLNAVQRGEQRRGGFTSIREWGGDGVRIVVDDIAASGATLRDAVRASRADACCVVAAVH